MKKLLRTCLRPILMPFLNRATRDIQPEDVWSRKEKDIPFFQFGPGSLHEWRWYFQGRSTVKIQTPSEIVRWLRGCSYVGDRLLFQEEDFWQHPLTFEQLRKGDCEDHALWAWRKLSELGVPAEFVIGRCGSRDATDAQAHAWVQLELNGEPYLMETVAGTRQPMTFPLADVQKSYCPAYAVDSEFKTYEYGGLVEFLRLSLKQSSHTAGEPVG